MTYEELKDIVDKRIYHIDNRLSQLSDGWAGPSKYPYDPPAPSEYALEGARGYLKALLEHGTGHDKLYDIKVEPCWMGGIDIMLYRHEDTVCTARSLFFANNGDVYKLIETCTTSFEEFEDINF